MLKKIRFIYPLLFSLLLYWCLTFLLLGASLAKTNGHFGYPLDDTYIHMAIAKHFTNNGFWGISQTGFSSSTSSPFWTLLIALAYKAFGVHDWIPFALCLLCGSCLLIVCHHLFQRTFKSPRLTVLLTLLVLLPPLPVLTLMGMEHILQSLFTLWLIYCATMYLNKNESNSRELIFILVLAGLVAITRYEGLFLIFSIMLLFLITKRFFAAFLIFIAGLLPLSIYGIISIAQGWYFLPNSVLLKGNALVFSLEGIATFFLRLFSNSLRAPHILVLIFASLCIHFLFLKQDVTRKKERILIIIFLLMSFMHLQFAGTGWFYRYEAYLVLIGIVILMDVINSLYEDRVITITKTFNNVFVLALGVVSSAALIGRSINAFKDYPTAVMNIFDQQYQMGLFLKKYYSEKTIAANDLGAINYLADIKTLDLYGLGSMDVFQAKQSGVLDNKEIDALASKHNAVIVIIYRSLFDGKIPADWVEIGRWQIPDNVVCADDVVTFYAPKLSAIKDVIANLRDFSNILPSTVKQSGIYTAP